MSTGRRTIAVIGAGNVGATCAFSLAERKLGNIVMLDIFEGFAKGKALDMSQAAQILNYDGVVKGTSSYEDIEGAEDVVVTSGFPRKPGMTREDLISKNASIISEVGAGIKKYAPDSVVIVVTNPLDLMTYHMWKATGFPHHRVVGLLNPLAQARRRHWWTSCFKALSGKRQLSCLSPCLWTSSPGGPIWVPKRPQHVKDAKTYKNM